MPYVAGLTSSHVVPSSRRCYVTGLTSRRTCPFLAPVLLRFPSSLLLLLLLSIMLSFCVFCCQGILAMVVGLSVTVVCYCLVVVLLFKRVVRLLVFAAGRFDGFCRAAVKPSNSAYSICIFQTSLCTLFSCMCITNCETIKTMKNSFRFYMLKPFVTSQDLTETLKAISNYDLTSYVV